MMMGVIICKTKILALSIVDFPLLCGPTITIGPMPTRACYFRTGFVKINWIRFDISSNVSLSLIIDIFVHVLN